MANIRLTAPIKATDEGEDETTIYIEAIEGAHTKKINNIEETREQDSHRRDTISVTN